MTDPLLRDPTYWSPALQRALLGQIFARDFEAFSQRAFAELNPGGQLGPSWHHAAIARVLTDALTGRITRLLITMPPRSLKSHMISVAFPAWAMGRNPALQFLCTSYNDELAVHFGNQWRSVCAAPWYRSAFPDAGISARKNREEEVHMARGGCRLSVAAGGALTGRGADIIIIDDPLKALEAYSEAMRGRINDWFGQTVVSRLNDKKTGVTIVVMQRLHVDDLAGKLIDEGGWHHLNLPAVAPGALEIPLTKGQVMYWQEGMPLQAEREPPEVLKGLKSSMGTAAFNAQYLQCPVPREGNLIAMKNFVCRDTRELNHLKGEWLMVDCLQIIRS